MSILIDSGKCRPKNVYTLDFKYEFKYEYERKSYFELCNNVYKNRSYRRMQRYVLNVYINRLKMINRKL